MLMLMMKSVRPAAAFDFLRWMSTLKSGSLSRSWMLGKFDLGEAVVDLLLEAEHRLEELGRRRHHRLRGLPRRVDLLEGHVLGLQQAEARRRHVVDARGRLLERLELAQVLDVE